MKIEIVKSKGEIWVKTDGWWDQKFETITAAESYVEIVVKNFKDSKGNKKDEVIKTIEI